MATSGEAGDARVDEPQETVRAGSVDSVEVRGEEQQIRRDSFDETAPAAPEEPPLRRDGLGSDPLLDLEVDKGGT